jgi:hypothetical protein
MYWSWVQELTMARVRFWVGWGFFLLIVPHRLRSSRIWWALANLSAMVRLPKSQPSPSNSSKVNYAVVLNSDIGREKTATNHIIYGCKHYQNNLMLRWHCVISFNYFQRVVSHNFTTKIDWKPEVRVCFPRFITSTDADFRGRDSSIGIATGYGLEVRGSNLCIELCDSAVV